MVCRYCGHQFDKTEIIKTKEIVEIEGNLEREKFLFEKRKKKLKKYNISGKCLTVVGALSIFLVVMIFFFVKDFNLMSTIVGILISCLFLIPGNILRKKADKIEMDLQNLRKELARQKVDVDF